MFRYAEKQSNRYGVKSQMVLALLFENLKVQSSYRRFPIITFKSSSIYNFIVIIFVIVLKRGKKWVKTSWGKFL